MLHMRPSTGCRLPACRGAFAQAVAADPKPKTKTHFWSTTHGLVLYDRNPKAPTKGRGPTGACWLLHYALVRA